MVGNSLEGDDDDDPTDYHEEVLDESGEYPSGCPCELKEIEKESIRRALKRNDGDSKRTARDLGISERTLCRKIKEYEL